MKLNFTYEVHIVADGKYGDQKTEETKKKRNKDGKRTKGEGGGVRERERRML